MDENTPNNTVQTNTLQENNLQENKYIVLFKRAVPTIVHVINIIIYSILNFIRTSIRYIIDQLRTN